jgi:DNA invertase Pin-like site-specific DNA recombinase
MARIGYARVSTLDQDYATEEERLRAAGCDVVRAEKATGKTRDGRDELASVMEFIRCGDELVVVRLDRLGRSPRDVHNLVHDLDQKGAGLRVLELEFTTLDNPIMGQLLVSMLAAVAGIEHTWIRERQRAGIEAAKKAGVYKGRKATVPADEVRRMRAEGMIPGAIAEALGVSRMSVWRALNGRAVLQSKSFRF